MPDLPAGAVGAFDAWRLLNQLRDFPAAGSVIMAQARLAPFEVGLLATIEVTMQAAWKKQPQPQQDEE